MGSLLSLVEVNIGNIWMQLQHSTFLHRGDDVIQESAGESWEKEPMGGTFPKDPQLLSIPDVKWQSRGSQKKNKVSLF